MQPNLTNPENVKITDAYWRLNDPLPWVVMMIDRIKKHAHAIKSRIG
jgi:hypothetical protein